MSERWVIVTHEGVDTLHRNPGESCNLDDTEADREVDEFTAEAMLAGGHARPCEHCLRSERGELEQPV